MTIYNLIYKYQSIKKDEYEMLHLYTMLYYITKYSYYLQERIGWCTLWYND